MAKTLGTLDSKTPIHEIGDYMVYTSAALFGEVYDGGKLCTHLATSSTTGGTVNFTDVTGVSRTIYLARDMGWVQVLFTSLSSSASLTEGELWVGRTANFMINEQTEA